MPYTPLYIPGQSQVKPDTFNRSQEQLQQVIDVLERKIKELENKIKDLEQNG